MKSADYVAQQIETWKKDKKPLMWICWQVALLCIGWAYVYAALGQYCTVANRKSFYKSHGADHSTIKTKCQVIRDEDPKPSCSGCKWYPGGQKTRIFDCRGFIYWILYIVCGFKLSGGGCTSQWNTAKNWAAKGTIDSIPMDEMVCVFQYNPSKKNMKHTGFAYNGETVECQVGVQHKKLDGRWTHWALPACFADGYTMPAEKPKEDKPKEDKVNKPTLRKGASGSSVKELQNLLIEKGYSCGAKGTDGKFGDSTLAAVKAFQKANGLKVDGVVGSATWSALLKAAPDAKKYTVTITGLSSAEAEDLKKKYPGAVVKEG